MQIVMLAEISVMTGHGMVHKFTVNTIMMLN